jgi:hypothetical protein
MEPKECFMPDEIPTSRESTDDAKDRTEEIPRAVREAQKKVRRHIEKEKPGPASETVDPSPRSRPKE